MGDLVAENAGAMGWMKRGRAVTGLVSGWDSFSVASNDRLFDILVPGPVVEQA